MDFFDTVAGHEFATRTIPQLTRALEKINNRKQYLVEYKGSSLPSRDIAEEIAKGARVVSMVSHKDKLLVIYEK